MNPKLVLVCLATALTSLMQAMPDFSGKWILNLEETEFTGAKPSAASYSVIRTVEQKPKQLRLKIERSIGGQKGGFDFVTIPIGGGQPHVSNEAGIISAHWKDQTLHFDYLYNPGTERESMRTEDWTLSADGSKLIDQEWARRPDGKEFRYKVVFNRQP